MSSTRVASPTKGTQMFSILISLSRCSLQKASSPFSLLSIGGCVCVCVCVCMCVCVWERDSVCGYVFLVWLTEDLFIQDSEDTDLMCHFRETNDFIRTASQRPNSLVLVHCRAGRSRSASLVAAYLIGQICCSVCKKSIRTRMACLLCLYMNKPTTQQKCKIQYHGSRVFASLHGLRLCL